MKSNGAMYSLKQAAEAVGRGKPAILRAIQRGIISAQRSAKNEWLIDPAELHRVYPPVSRNGAESVQDERDATADATALLKQENDFLKLQLDRERDFSRELSRRLDDEAAERRRLTALLTHQPKPVAAPVQTEQQGKGKLWEKMFGRAGN